MDVPGHRVSGRYELESRLGAGRAGQVFAARDLRTKVRVAVKLREPDDAVFLDIENSALRSVEHPHLLRILDAGTDGGRIFVVTELASGGALSELPKPLPPGSLHALASQMLEALAALHALRILHGDVKPENILLAELAPPHFKLADFGLAQRSVDAAAGTTRGSPAYMPPEIIRGEPADERSDLYSLGVTLYECAFGTLPFDDADVRTVLMRHLTETPRRLQDAGEVEPRLVSLLRRLLAKEPAARPADARVALALWRGDAAAAPRWVPPRLGILIGRDTELDRLERALADTTPAIGIDAPSGLGKTRLLRELALRAELHGVLVAWWTPRGLQGLDASGAQDAVEAAASAFPALPSDPRAFAESRARDVLANLGDVPWLLLVDDTDAAPGWFVDSVSYLLREVASVESIGRLVCVTGRERGVQIVQDALEAGGFNAPPGLVLEPWTPADLEAAASALLGARRLHANLLDLLRSATGNIPAEVEAACQQLAEKELLRLDTHGVLTVAAETTPQDILQPSESRAAAALARCTPAQLRLLQILAALSAPASPELLQALQHESDAAWMELHRAGLVTTSTGALGAHIALAYEGLRQATLDSIPTESKRRLHDRIADLLDADPHIAPDEYSAIHRAEGTDLPAARLAVEHLSKRSTAISRPELLESAYEELLELWPRHVESDARLDATLALLDIELQLGAYEKVRQLATQSLREETVGAERLQSVRNRLAQAFVFLGESDEALQLLQDDTKGRPGLESRILRAQLLSNLGRYDEVLRLCDAAEPDMDIEDPLAVPTTDLRASSLNALGSATEAAELLRSSIAARENRSAAHASGLLLLRLGFIEFYQGQMDVAEISMNRAGQAFRAAGDRRGMVRTLNNLAGVYGETGRYADALEQLRMALDLCRRLGETDSLSHIVGNIAQLLLMQARYQEALKYADESIEIGIRRHLVTTTVQSQIGRGGILAALGLEQLCHDELEPVLDRVMGQVYEGQILLLWSDLALRRDEHDIVSRWLDQAQRVFTSVGAEDELVRHEIYVSRLAWAAGNRSAAIAAARSASQKSHSLGLVAQGVEADTLQVEYLVDDSPSDVPELSRKTLKTAERALLPENIWRLHRVMGRLAVARGDIPAALAEYRACIGGISEICSNLPPTYLDSYLASPDRERVFEESRSIRALIEGSG